MEMDYRKLKGRITEYYGTRKAFAKDMGLSERSICLKLNSKIDFSQSEIMKAVNLLKIEYSNIDEYFFTVKV